MTDRVPSDEWKASSDWDDVVGWNGGYILGVGYCYTEQFANFFHQENKKYHSFQTKWGRCGTTFLFSALRPDNIIIPVAWGNAAITCQSTDVLFRIWADILKNLLSLKVKTLMVDFPAAWHVSDLSHDMGGLENMQIKIDERRQEYYNHVIKPYQSMNNFEYIDLYDYIPYDSRFIHENIQEPKVVTAPSPWHMTQDLIDIVGKYFLDFVDSKNNIDQLVNSLK